MNKKKRAPQLVVRDHFDANIQASNMGAWQQRYDQISSGPFSGSIKELALPSIKLFAEQSSRALRQECAVGEAGLWLGFSDSAEFKINGHQGNAEKIFCRSGLADFELVTPESFCIYSLVIEQSVLEALNLVSQAEVNALQLSSVTPARVNSLKVYLKHLLSGDWLTDSCEKILLDAVADILQADAIEHEEGLSLSQRYRVIKRVDQYLNEEQLKTPVTVDELCQVAFVSRRTLQYCMQDCLGLSPKQYIRSLRLNQVRRRFLDPEENKNISDLAFEHGYFHLGQFGQDYKRLFGETPGQTINRFRSH